MFTKSFPASPEPCGLRLGIYSTPRKRGLRALNWDSWLLGGHKPTEGSIDVTNPSAKCLSQWNASQVRMVGSGFVESTSATSLAWSL